MVFLKLFQYTYIDEALMNGRKCRGRFRKTWSDRLNPQHSYSQVKSKVRITGEWCVFKFRLVQDFNNSLSNLKPLEPLVI